MDISIENAQLSPKKDPQKLFTAETTVSWDAVRTMQHEVNGKQAVRNCLALFALLLLLVATALTTAIVLLLHFRPEGSMLSAAHPHDAYVVKGWVHRLYSCALFLWFASLLYGVLFRMHRNNQSSRKRAAKIILNSVTGILALGAMFVIGWLSLEYSLTVPEIVRNANGSYTVSVETYSGAEYWLYEDAGPFYLHYLRPMADAKDTDPNISATEWQAMREAENMARDENFEADSSLTEPSSAEASGETAASKDTSRAGDQMVQQIETGYRMLYHAYFAFEGDHYEMQYDSGYLCLRVFHRGPCRQWKKSLGRCRECGIPGTNGGVAFLCLNDNLPHR